MVEMTFHTLDYSYLNTKDAGVCTTFDWDYLPLSVIVGPRR
jgi:hypothetical protein